MTKICKGCGAVRDEVCLPCKAARARKWRKEHAVQIKAKQKIYHENCKAKLAAEKAGVVVKDDVKHPPWLTVHHIGDSPRSRDACQAPRQFPQMASPLESLE